MKRILVSAAATFFLSSSLLAAEPSADYGVLAIDAGRLGAMLYQSRIAMIQAKHSFPEPLLTPAQIRPFVFEQLVSAVWSYNDVMHQVCQEKQIDSALCRGPYLPSWVGGKAGDYDDAQLRAMTDEATGRIMPFWEAICASARANGAPDPVCPME